METYFGGLDGKIEEILLKVPTLPLFFFFVRKLLHLLNRKRQPLIEGDVFAEFWNALYI